jgi:hypothetical protein
MLNPMLRSSFRLILTGSALASPLHGAIRGPYPVDADTVHLFHFDEAAGATLAVNAVAGAPSGIAFDGNPPLNHATNPQPADATVLGAAAGLPGYGAAARVAAADLGIGLDANGSGGFQMGLSTGASPDAIPHALLAGADGSFTLEALVKLPSITGSGRQILCTDNSLANHLRGFQFRINTTGGLEFNFIDTNAAGTSAPIPTSGTHGFVANEWFHAAVSHHGPTSTTTFYWTRMASAAETANALLTSSAETTSGNVAGPLVIGNEARANGGSSEALLGEIDEVRVSRVARAADDFHFTSNADAPDSDEDGLPDFWELLHGVTLEVFSGLDGADHDLDGASDLAEYQAGSNPANPLSTPADTDADGLADADELRYFGGLAQGPDGDPDGDGESTASELANGSAPNHRASHSGDTDADGLPDAWETEHFGGLAGNGGSDFDGDGFGSLQEHAAGTDPTDPASRPAGTAVRLVPLDDGDHATSDFGYAGSSAINTVAFVRSCMQTVGDQQFVTWYGRHQHDAAAAFNNTIWIGRRTLGSSEWEIFRHPSFTANNITDGHDVISHGIDGDGYMHLSWGMHGDPFHYSRSTTPVTGDVPIVLGPDTTMTGRENNVTYPQFLRLPDGDLLYLFREGGSGNGNTFLNRYDTATGTWDNVHRSGTTQLPFIRGTGWTPNYNAYPNMPQLDADGHLILTWCWRYEPGNNDSPAGEDGYQTNNNFAFGRSPDGGATWQRQDGTPYALPISRDGESGDPATAAEHVVVIPEGRSLINQGGMCLDRAGNPVIASWWAPEAPLNHRRQYMVAFRHADGSWQTRPVSNRTNNPTTTKYNESAVRDLGRPVVVNDDSDRVIVAYRDDAGDNGITISHSLPLAEDPDRLLWIEFDLTRENLGNLEPMIDNELWDRDRQLHFLHQPSSGKGYVPPANTAARISVLEWDAAAYFAHRPQPSITRDGDTLRLSCPSEPSWSYKLWSSLDLDDWELEETRDGTGGELVFTRVLAPGETKRYWRIEFIEGGP